MRTKTIVGSIILIVAIFAGLACNSTTEKFEAEKEQYIENTKIELKKIEDRIIALRERADNILTENQEAFRKDLEALSKAQNAAEQKFNEVKNASQENWILLKNEMDEHLTKLDSLNEKARDW